MPLCGVGAPEPGGDAEGDAPAVGDSTAGCKLPEQISRCSSGFLCLAPALYTTVSSTVPLGVLRRVSVVLGRGTTASGLIVFHPHRLYYHLNCSSRLGKPALLMACVCWGLLSPILCDQGCTLPYAEFNNCAAGGLKS